MCPKSPDRPSILTPHPSELPGEGYRKDQIARWLYITGARSFEEMTNLPKEMREELTGAWRISAFDEVEAFESSDGSV
ncbi:MAG: 23S rRNA (adenine(2503)-C(2))-methyltransferase RlmN, partial [bacterium]